MNTDFKKKLQIANTSNLIFNKNNKSLKLSKKVHQQQSQLNKSFNSISILESLSFKKSKFLRRMFNYSNNPSKSFSSQNDSSADSKIKLIKKSRVSLKFRKFLQKKRNQ